MKNKFISLAIFIFVLASVNFAQTVKVPDDYTSIQAAIDAAAPGATVEVAAGTYSENIIISKALTLLSTTGAASTIISANSATAVTINADNVVINGFTITNPSGKHGIFVQDHSSITINNNIIDDIASGDVSTSGTNFGIAVVSSASNVDAINIEGNIVSNVFGGNFKSADAIAVGWSTGANNVTNLTIQNNTVSNISSSTLDFSSGGRGAYGILLNHGTSGQTVGAQIINNTIDNLEGLWAHAIGLEGNTPNALVQGNIIGNIVDYKSPGDPDAVAIMFEDNASANTVTVNANSFSNVLLGVRNATALTVKVEANWWGDTDPSDNIYNTGGGSVDYSPWWNADYVGDSHTSAWTWNTNDVIQDAIDAASAGDIINVSAGTYTENININKYISLIGTLSGSNLATFLVPSTDNPVVTISASGISNSEPLLLQNFNIHTSDVAPASGEGKMTGIRIAPATSLSHIKIDNVDVIGNNHPYPGLESGFDIAADASVTDLVIVNSLFKDLSYGIISGAITSGNPGTLDDVTISFCEFDHNSSKGLYFERLSNALLSNLYIHDNGSDQALMASWAQPYGAGIDINLKYGSYSGIVLSALTVENNGLNAKEGMGIGIKARDDAPTYSSVPGSLDDVLVTNCTITGNERGIRAGEPNKNNLTPTNLVVTNSNIYNNVQTYVGIDGSGYGDLVNYSQASIKAENNYWGSVLESKIQNKIYNYASVDYDPWQGKAVNPTNMQTGVTIYLNQITWSTFANGHYDFMLYEGGPMGGGGTQVGATKNDITTTLALIPNPLDYDTTYYWYIKSHLVSEWDEFQFTTATPTTAYLSTPVNGSTNYGTTIYFAWYTLAQGIRFDLQIDDDPAFGSPTTIASNISALNYTYNGSSLVPGTTYKWRVISKTPGGDTTGYSSVWSFTMPGIPNPTVTYPTGSVTIYNNPPTLYWYTNGYHPTHSYIIRYWKDGETTPASPTAQTNLSGYFNSNSPNLYAALTATLDAGATYYWEVATTDGSYNSSWSSPTSSFVVYSSVPAVPPVPITSWPGAGTTSYLNPPTLYWYIGMYATGLQFEVEWDDDSNLDDSPLGSSGWITNYYYAIPANLSGGTIYWRVRSRIGGSGTPSAWSTVDNFEIPSYLSDVPVPTLTYPIGGTTAYSLNQTLYWYDTFASTLEYQVNVSEYPDVDVNGELNNSNAVYPSSTTFTTNVQYSLSNLTAGTTYYWQVRARIAGSSGTESAWSPVASFTTAAGSFAVVPLIASPNHGQPISNTSAVLSWIIPTQSESPLTYEVEFSENQDMSNAVNINCENKPFAELNSLNPKVTYYWRVKSKTSNGAVSNYSAIGSFKVDKNITDAEADAVPTEYSLLQNYPNPFNPTTRISFSLPEKSFVTLKVYDVLGREVKTLVNNEMNAGNLAVDWNGNDNYGNKVASGTYIYRITAGNFVSAKKMVLIK